MPKPYRRKNSSAYYVDLWSHGARRTVALGTDNYGMARAVVGQLESKLHTKGFALPTKTELAPLLGRYEQHMFAHRPRKSAQTDAYRLREVLGSPVNRSVGTPAPKRPIRGGGRRPAKQYPFAVQVRFVEQVSTSLLTDALLRLGEERGIAPKTWNEYRLALRGFFRWSTEVAGVRLPTGDNPAARIPSRTVSQTRIVFLNLAQVHEQLAALTDHPQVQAMVAVYLYAGLRREEALWLTPDDVDLERRVVHVRAKTVGSRSWRPKTNRNRRVAISQALHGVLTGYRTHSKSPWYFPAPHGGWWDPDNFSHALADLNQKAGLDWSCAEYRHTFGTQLAMAGRDERTIAELMGNSPEIVRRHYAAWLPEAHPEAVEFDTPQGPEPMADTRTANLRVEAQRRGLRVVSGD